MERPKMAVLNFKCKKCNTELDFEVGKIRFGMRISFENDIICKNCGELELGDLELTEWGQTQAAELYFSDMHGE